jgi:hypothetical protein
MKRKGLVMKLLSNPASDTPAQITAGFAIGHATPSSLEIPHCDHRDKFMVRFMESRRFLHKQRRYINGDE